MNVLLVDKPPSLLEALNSAARQLGLGVSVTTVSSSDAARLALQGANPFDLILLNVNVDNAGYELLHEAGAAKGTNLVLVLCAFDCEAEIVRSLSLGATGFLSNVASGGILLEILCVAATKPPTSRLPRGDGRTLQLG